MAGVGCTEGGVTGAPVAPPLTGIGVIGETATAGTGFGDARRRRTGRVGGLPGLATGVPWTEPGGETPGTPMTLPVPPPPVPAPPPVPTPPPVTTTAGMTRPAVAPPRRGVAPARAARGDAPGGSPLAERRAPEGDGTRRTVSSDATAGRSSGSVRGSSLAVSGIGTRGWDSWRAMPSVTPEAMTATATVPNIASSILSTARSQGWPPTGRPVATAAGAAARATAGGTTIAARRLFRSARSAANSAQGVQP